MSETIFSKIIDGKIPCYKIYEDSHVLAFLDVQPLSDGHTLVIPKEAAKTLDQLSDDSAAALGRALPKICRAVMKITGTTEYNILGNAQHTETVQKTQMSKITRRRYRNTAGVLAGEASPGKHPPGKTIATAPPQQMIHIPSLRCRVGRHGSRPCRGTWQLL